mmetsp:Transcript_26409/g.46765  ORF Transcript_26409/g.46765 Transcript_26409/m.46765 type:complete len:297 (+) Transcript_26409:109-999(+)
MASSYTPAVSGGSSSSRCCRPPLPPQQLQPPMSPLHVASAGSRHSSPQPQTPRTPRTARAPCWTPVWTPRISTPRTPQQAMLQWRAEEFAEKQEVSECMDALFRHRKATLRFLRRCEDAKQFSALQTALCPMPRRSGPLLRRHSSQQAECRGRQSAAAPGSWGQQASLSPTLQPSVRGWESVAVSAIPTSSPRLAWPARAAALARTQGYCTPDAVTPRTPRRSEEGGPPPARPFLFAAPTRECFTACAATAAPAPSLGRPVRFGSARGAAAFASAEERQGLALRCSSGLTSYQAFC